MGRVLDKKEKKAVRIKINNLIDDKCGNCSEKKCDVCSIEKEIHRLSSLIGCFEDKKPKIVKQPKPKKERVVMSGLNGLTPQKYEELKDVGKSNLLIEREFNIRKHSLKNQMKKHFNYDISNKPKGLEIKVVEPVVVFAEYQKVSVQFNKVNMENHSLQEEIKDLKNRIAQLELYNKMKQTKLDMFEDAEIEHEEKVNRLHQSIKDLQNRIDKMILDGNEILEENLELRTVLKRVL
jgi:regulator of replication initiation timing